jgi:hypothetical protein
MRIFLPGVPEPGEYSEFFAGYVAKAQPCSDPVKKLEEQLALFWELMGPLDEKTQLHRYAPGKWSVKEMVGHVIDAERIFAYRALRIGRADQTPLPGFDENSYVEASEADRCDWRLLLEEFTHVRTASYLMLGRMPEAAWTRRGTASGAPISMRGMAHVMIGHVAHHMEIVRTRYL